MPANVKQDTYIWRMGMLVGNDPRTAKYWRCMIADKDGKVHTKGKHGGLVKYTADNHSNIKKQYLSKYFDSHYDEFASTSAKSLQAAKVGFTGGW